MEKKVFRSRVSVLLIIGIGGPLLWPLILLIRSGNIFHPVFFIFTGLIVFFVYMIRSIRYVLTDKEIQFCCGEKLRGKILISAIVSIERSYEPHNFCAASFKKMRFIFNKDYKRSEYFSSSRFLPFIPLISPVCEQEFLETLKTLNPNIRINVSDRKGWWRIWDWDI